MDILNKLDKIKMPHTSKKNFSSEEVKKSSKKKKVLKREESSSSSFEPKVKKDSSSKSGKKKVDSSFIKPKKTKQVKSSNKKKEVETSSSTEPKKTKQIKSSNKKNKEVGKKPVKKQSSSSSSTEEVKKKPVKKQEISSIKEVKKKPVKKQTSSSSSTEEVKKKPVKKQEISSIEVGKKPVDKELSLTKEVVKKQQTSSSSSTKEVKKKSVDKELSSTHSKSKETKQDELSTEKKNSSAKVKEEILPIIDQVKLEKALQSMGGYIYTTIELKDKGIYDILQAGANNNKIVLKKTIYWSPPNSSKPPVYKVGEILDFGGRSTHWSLEGLSSSQGRKYYAEARGKNATLVQFSPGVTLPILNHDLGETNILLLPMKAKINEVSQLDGVTFVDVVPYSEDKLNFYNASMYEEEKLILVPQKFINRGEVGDFNWMIKQEKYKKDLFIFNDNAEDMRSGTFEAGGGNAIIRPYKNKKVPRAWGIPTGSEGEGFTSLNKFAKEAIDESIQVIRKLITNNSYKYVYYSAGKDGKIGTGIFKVAPEVLDYILTQLKSLCKADSSD